LEVGDTNSGLDYCFELVIPGSVFDSQMIHFDLAIPSFSETEDVKHLFVPKM